LYVRRKWAAAAERRAGGDAAGQARRQDILRAVAGRPLEPFHYFNYGNKATIGRAFAVADIGGIKASGFLAWLLWLFLHLFRLIGFRNRLAVMGEWAWA
jgi:NADH dehydrogenase